MFSFSTFGVARIASGRIVRGITVQIAALNVAPCSEIFSKLLSANLYQLKENVSSVTLFNYYENKDITLNLDINLTPAENLKKIFKKEKKASAFIKKWLSKGFEVLFF